jgi:HSP20 family protein
MASVIIKPGSNRPGTGGNSKPAYFVSRLSDWQVAPRSNVWSPPTDVYETADAVIVRVEIAGMQGENLSVSLDKGLLTISGVRQEQTEKRAFHQMEIRFGEFETQIDLSIPIDFDKVEAVYSDGFLRIVLPKAVPRTIRISQE